MGKTKGPSLPPTPTYQTDPIFSQGYQDLSKYANQLISGDYSGFGGLQDAVSLHPQDTQMALNAASGFLQPQYAQSNLDIQNMAIANNQNTSSTFTDALAKNALTLNSQYQGIASGAALNDAQSSRQNQLGLFEQGLNTLQGATQFGLGNQNAQNQFNLENYSNLVAKTLGEQKQQNGGFMGALTGGLGGALGGFATTGNPFGAAIGGIGGALSGGFTPQSANLGGNLLNVGAGLYGAKQQSNALSSLFGNGFGNQNASVFGSGTLPGFFATNSSTQSGILKGLMDALK